MGDRKANFAESRILLEKEQVDEALTKIQPYCDEKDSELSGEEMEWLEAVLSEKLTSSGFGDEKKAACQHAIDTLSNLKLMKDSLWLNSYSEVLYETYSKMNRCARDEERENAWCRLKEMYLEVLMMARKIWKDKNHPERLQVYVRLAKLCKSYLDVADEETIEMCQEAAKEAKFMGKGAMEDDDWKDANKLCLRA